MIKFYLMQIKLGKMTIEEVPNRWYEAVVEKGRKNE